MDNLIPLMNKIQDVFQTLQSDPVDLPQIAVVGSGKSSVLENIVGRDFLPRGTGIVTRRPLLLQLVNVPWPEEDADDATDLGGLGSKAMAEWGEFLHLPGQMFYHFDEIRHEIQKETDRLAGKRKGIDATPIVLKVFSPSVLNLTLIDLPGITKVPVGDQPPDIDIQVKDMILSFIEKPNTIILAVSAANTDIANSDALQLASEVDPDGLRTVGVVTKLDLMDSGTNALDVLLGNVYELRLGFIGVVNRSQKDINDGKPIRDALKAESSFFSNHQYYRGISSRSGTRYLSKTLNKVLIQHIRNCLPDLRSRVAALMAQTQEELDSYGDPIFDSPGGKQALILRIVTQFASDFRDAIDGRRLQFDTREIYGGARIGHVFNEVFVGSLQAMPPGEGLSIADIRTAICNATGARSSLFIPEVAFEMLAKRQIAKLEAPSLQCVELVMEELLRIVSRLDTTELRRFPALREGIVEVATDLLRQRLHPTNEFISNLIQVELAYINTNHPDFMQGSQAVSAAMDKLRIQQPRATSTPAPQAWQQDAIKMSPMPAASPAVRSTVVEAEQHKKGGSGFFSSIFFGDKSGTADAGRTKVDGKRRERFSHGGDDSVMATKHTTGTLFLEPMPNVLQATDQLSEREKMETELIQSLISSYFSIVLKSVMDQVPKAVMHFLVNYAKDHLHSILTSELYQPERVDILLAETSDVAQRRSACKEMLGVLKRAQEILLEVRDYDFGSKK